jgi:hypothetical protein
MYSSSQLQRNALGYKDAVVEDKAEDNMDAVQLWTRIFLCPVIIPCLFCVMFCTASDSTVAPEVDSTPSQEESESSFDRFLKNCCSCIIEYDDTHALPVHQENKSSITRAAPRILSRRPPATARTQIVYELATNLARTDRLVTTADGRRDSGTFYESVLKSDLLDEDCSTPLLPYLGAGKTGVDASTKHSEANGVFKPLPATQPFLSNECGSALLTATPLVTGSFDLSRRSTYTAEFSEFDIPQCDSDDLSTPFFTDRPSKGAIAAGSVMLLDIKEDVKVQVMDKTAGQGAGWCSRTPSLRPLSSELPATVRCNGANADTSSTPDSDVTIVESSLVSCEGDDTMAQASSDSNHWFDGFHKPVNKMEAYNRIKIAGPSVQTVQHLMAKTFGDDEDDCKSVQSGISLMSMSSLGHAPAAGRSVQVNMSLLR